MIILKLIFFSKVKFPLLGSGHLFSKSLYTIANSKVTSSNYTLYSNYGLLFAKLIEER